MFRISSSKVVGFDAETFFLINVHKFSMGLRSGEFPGHPSTLTWCGGCFSSQGRGGLYFRPQGQTINASRKSLVVASLDKMLHDDYFCLVESSEQQIKEVRRKFNRKTRKQRQLLSEFGFVLRIAPPPLSRDRRIKMKKSINQSL